MKKFKLLSLSLLSLILIVVLSACGSSTPNAAVSNAPSNAPSAAPEATKAAVTPEPGKKVDLGGRTINISLWWDGAPKPDSEDGKALIAKQKEVEDRYNVKIQYINVPYADQQSKLATSVLAGQPFADIARLQYDWALTAVTKGNLLKLNDYMDLNRVKGRYDAAPSALGENYGFDAPAGDGGGLFFNRAVFKKLGLDDPQDLFAQGKWNWDAFETIAKKATQDKNFGLSGFDQDLAQFLVVSNGSNIVDEKTGKELVSDPKTVEALDFLNKLYNVDHVVKIKKDSGDYNERDTFGDGDVAMEAGWGWMSGGFKTKKIDFGFVPFPNGPKATADGVAPASGGHAWYIPKGVKDPQIVAQIFTEMNDIPTKDSYPGQSYMEGNWSSQKDIDLVKKAISVSAVINIGAYPDFPWGNMVIDMLKNKVPAATAVEKVKQQAQASVDKILKK